MSPRSLYNSNFVIYIYNRTTCKYYCLFKRITITTIKFTRHYLGFFICCIYWLFNQLLKVNIENYGEVMPRQTCLGQMPEYV